MSSGNQFGCDEETIREIIAKREEYPNVSIMGLQYYSGTQKKKLTKMKEELHFLEELIVSLQADFGFITKELEYGPGFYVAYYEREQKINEEAVMVSFLLGNTLSDNGSVTRGVCRVDRNRFLEDVEETYNIIKTKDGAGTRLEDGAIRPIPVDAPVSMLGDGRAGRQSGSDI